MTIRDFTNLHGIVETTHVSVSIRECGEHHRACYHSNEDRTCSINDNHWDHEHTEHCQASHRVESGYQPQVSSSSGLRDIKGMKELEFVPWALSMQVGYCHRNKSYT